MKRQISIAKAGALALVLLMSTSAFAGWWDGIESAQPVSLQELIDSPRAFKGKEVTFTCVFHEVSKYYNPYYTRFIPSVYVNFTVWPSGKELWNESDYLDGFSFCFLERDHKAFQELVAMKKFTRLRLTGYVQNTFKGSPWIEVRHVEVLQGALSTDSLGSVIKGDRAADGGDWEAAVAFYGAAAQSSLPAEVVASISKKHGIALERTGRLQDAGIAYARAVQAAPDDEEAAGLLAAVMAKLPGFALPGDLTPANPGVPAARPAALAGSESPARARPVDADRYPARPMAMPAPVEPKAQRAEPMPEVVPTPEVEVPAAPVEVPAAPVEVEPPVPAIDRPGMEFNPEKINIDMQPGAPVEPDPARKPVPKKRLSGPV